ncbi:MAG: four helix bundle protein, partial [bacterium]
VKLYCSLPTSRTEVQVMGKQLLRSGTAVGALYREASRARSDAEFVSKIETCIQEADESDLWLDLLEADCGIRTESLIWLRRETEEMICILVTVVKNVKNRNSK